MIDYQCQPPFKPFNKQQSIVHRIFVLSYLRYSRLKGKIIQYNLFSTGGLKC